MRRLPLTLGTFGILGLTAAIIFTQQPQVQGQAAAQGAPAGQAPPAQAPPPARGGGGGGRGGGPQAPPPPPQNLQILSKTMTTPEVQAYMQTQVAPALGVACGYCHAPAPTPPPAADGAAAAPARGRGGPQLDFASDDKQEKKTARVMLKMVNDLNAAVPMAVNKSAAEATQVQCVTCHRGVAKPAQLSTVLSDVMLSKGEGAAVAKYRELRTQYYGQQAYDFTEPVLARLAQQSLATNKPDDALAYLKLNLEYFPKSAQTYAGLSQVKVRKGDRTGAIKDLEQAVTLDPMNMAFKRQLDQLKAPPAAQ